MIYFTIPSKHNDNINNIKVLETRLEMNIQEYYNKAKMIEEHSDFLETKEGIALLNALNYDNNDHPSIWIPEVQKSLLNSYLEHSTSKLGQELLSLYEQGVVMEYHSKNHPCLIIGVLAFISGIILGFFLF
jgi:hypothetical protein